MNIESKTDREWQHAVAAGLALRYGRPTFVRFMMYTTIEARDEAIAALKAIGVPVEIVRP